MFSFLPSDLLTTVSIDKPTKFIFLSGLQHLFPKHNHLILEISAANSLPIHSFARLTFNSRRDTSQYYTSAISSEGTDVATWCSEKTRSTAYIHAIDVPPAVDAYGAGYVFLPYYNQADREKTTLGFFCQGGRGVVRTTGHYRGREPINEIAIELAKGLFEIGSVVRLYGVDQSMLLEEISLKSRGRLLFEDLSRAQRSLFFVGSVRSPTSGFAYAAENKGDRLYQLINGNRGTSYFYQRLTGEGHNHRSIAYKIKVALLRTIGWRLQNLLERLGVVAKTQLLCIQDQGGPQPRVAWVPNGEAANGLFGVHVILYPKPHHESMPRPWLSVHGAYDGVWNPVGTEAGCWVVREALSSIYLYPRGGPESKGRDSESGSIESLYEITPNRVLVDVEEEIDWITIDCPSGGHNLHVLVHAASRKASVDDLLGILFNKDRNPDVYRYQRMEAKDGTHMAEQTLGFEVANLPAADAEYDEFGIITIDIPEYNAQDRFKQVLSAYGGKRVVGLSGGEWRRHEGIHTVQIFLRSGAAFKIGSRIEVWVS